MKSTGKLDITPLFPIEYPPFTKVVVYFLKQYGVIESGEMSYYSQIEFGDINILLQEAGFENKGYLDKLINDEWTRACKANPLLTVKKFICNFELNYRNYNLEKYASIETQDRNKIIIKTYQEIVETINKLQGYLDPVNLRKRIDSNYLDRQTLYQCSTFFCSLAVICDERGEFKISYAFINNLRSVLSDILVGILEKRICDKTEGEIGQYIKRIAFEYGFDTRFDTRLKENSVYYLGFKKDFPIYVLRNKIINF